MSPFASRPPLAAGTTLAVLLAINTGSLFGALDPACEVLLVDAEEASMSRDLPLARTRFETCLRRVEGLPHDVQEARALRGLSEVALLEGNYELALGVAVRGLEVARKTGDPLRRVRGLQALGNAQFYLRDFSAALESFQAVVELTREDPREEAHALKDVGITFASLERLDQSMYYLELASRRFPLEQDGSLAIAILGNLGTTYRRLGAHGLAHAAFLRALEFAERTEVPEEIFDILGRLGYLQLHAGLPERALMHFRRAGDLIDRAGAGHQVWLLEGLAGVYEELGRNEEALRTNRRVFDIHERGGNRRGMTYAHVNLAYLLAGSDPILAEEHFARARNLGATIGFDWAFGAEAGLAALYRSRGELDRAVDSYRRALDTLESYRNRQIGASGRLSLLRQTRYVYDEAIDALLDRFARSPAGLDDEQAFQVFERGRGRVLLERIVDARLDPRADLSPDLNRRTKELDGRMRALRSTLDGTLRDDERTRKLQELAQVELESDELLPAIRRADPRFASIRYPEALSAGEVASMLDDRTALVAYAFLPQRTVAFVVTSSGLRVVELDAVRTIVMAQVDNLLDLLGDGTDGWQAVARRLGRTLVDPLLPALGPDIQDLAIVPDDSVSLLPFDVLLMSDGEKSEHMLIEDYSVAYIPSATLLRELRDGDDPTIPAAILLFADPDLPESGSAGNRVRSGQILYSNHGFEFGSMPHSVREARTITAHGGPESSMLTGDQATEAQLKRLPLERFGVLHFATHALLQDDGLGRSALVLGAGDPNEDGFVQAREISRLDLSVELVVLSACRTARGRVHTGEGVQGLAQAFFHAGAQTVVGSLWDVDDRQTYRFMRAFYRRLAEGHSKAQALRLAKLDQRRRESPGAPQAWAAFVLLGESDASVGIGVTKDGPLGAWVAFGGLATGFALLGLWRWRMSLRGRQSRGV